MEDDSASRKLTRLKEALGLGSPGIFILDFLFDFLLGVEHFDHRLAINDGEMVLVVAPITTDTYQHAE